MDNAELVEAVSSRPSLVDRLKGIINDVKIVGLEAPKKNRVYTPEALKKAIPLYEGAVVNVDHVETPESGGDQQKPVFRKFADRIGRLSGVYFKEGEGLFARTFKFNPKHRMAEDLMYWAAEDPNGVGFSHHAFGASRVSGGKQIVESIREVRSVDLVANPATTKGLFESESESVSGLQREVRELKEELTVYRAKELRQKSLLRAEEACRKAKLPSKLIAEAFLEHLVDLGESWWDRMIEDRFVLCRASRSTGRPLSREQRFDESEEELEEDNRGYETNADKVVALYESLDRSTGRPLSREQRFDESEEEPRWETNPEKVRALYD